MKTSNYYAVIFSSQRSDVEAKEYETMGDPMLELAKTQNGFLSVLSLYLAEKNSIKAVVVIISKIINSPLGGQALFLVSLP